MHFELDVCINQIWIHAVEHHLTRDIIESSFGKVISYAEIAHTVGYYYSAKMLVTPGFTLIGIGSSVIEDAL